MLRLVNPTGSELDITIAGVDDKGRMPGGDIRFVMAARESRTLTASQLEAGHYDLNGKLGVGAGKWQLFVTPVDGLVAMNLLASPTGHLSNLSTAIVLTDRSPPETGAETGFAPPRIIDEYFGGTRSLQLVDLDGDGDVDLLVTSEYTSGAGDRIVWYENTGRGTFGPARTVTDAVAHVVAAGAADLDGDGDLDVLYTSASDPAFAWVENLGRGHFGATRVLLSYGARGAPSEAASDLDGDGDLDLVIGFGPDETLLWFENLGGARFSEQRTLSAIVSQVHAFHVTDLDGDGDSDILAGTAGASGVSWIENLGGGMFAAPRSITTQPFDSVDTVDLDGDGDLDLITIDREPRAFGGTTLAWHENLGAVVFAERRLIDSNAPELWDPVAADIDGDGDFDLFAYSIDRINSRIWYENFGDGYFSAARAIETNARGLGPVAFVDLNADGRLDLVTSHNYDLVWYDNLGEVSAPTEAPALIEVLPEVGRLWITWNQISADGDGGSPVTEYVATAVSHVDGASKTCRSATTAGCTITGLTPEVTHDVRALARNRVGPGPESATVAATPLANPVTETEFGSGRKFMLNSKDSNGSFIAMTDLDDDGDADLLVFGDSHELAWYEGDNATFETRRVITTLASLSQLRTADMDGDGNTDILVASPDRNDLSWYRNLGDRSFADLIPIPTNGDGVVSLRPADIDGDGDLDVVSASRNDNTLEWHENTDGSFAQRNTHSIATVAAHLSAVLATDTDNDGDIDLVYRAYSPDSIVWRENQGGGRFAEPVTIVKDLPRSINMRDLDGDGDLDLLTTFSFPDEHGNVGLVAWYENQRAGLFAGQRVVADFRLGFGYSNMAGAADFDGDGDLDVLYTGSRNAYVRWAENLGEGVFSWGREIGEFDDISFLVPMDMNGDHNVDAVVASRARGELGWYENLGRATSNTASPTIVRKANETGQH